MSEILKPDEVKKNIEIGNNLIKTREKNNFIAGSNMVRLNEKILPYAKRISELEEANRWRKCSEELPDFNARVHNGELICLIDGMGQSYTGWMTTQHHLYNQYENPTDIRDWKYWKPITKPVEERKSL